MQVDVKLILQSPNAFIETLPQLLIGIPIPPTFNVLLLLLFFCKNLSGGGGCNQKWLYNGFEVLFGNLAANVWNLRWKTGFWEIIVSDKLCVFPDVSILRRETAPPGPIDVIPENPPSVLLPLSFTSTSSWSHVAPPHDATSPDGAFIIYHVYISYYLFIIYSRQIT